MQSMSGRLSATQETVKQQPQINKRPQKLHSPAPQAVRSSSADNGSDRVSRKVVVTNAGGQAATTTITRPAESSSGVSPTYVTREARRALFSAAQEQVKEVEASVSGQLPSWLNGALLINGGGDYDGMAHMFDGLAMLVKIRVQGGRVYGSQRYLQTEQYKHKKSTGRMKWREFATPMPAETPLAKAGQVFENMVALATNGPGFTDNASVHAIPLPGGEALACSETVSSMYRVRPSDLGTLGTLTEQLKSDGVPGQLLTAHPKPIRGGSTLVNFARSLPMGGFHVYLQDTRTLKRRKVAFIPDTDPTSPSWVHDLAATDNYAVILETPLLFNMPSLIFGGDRDYIFMDWRPEMGTKVHVVALDGSGVATFKAPPFFTFHTANAYEEAGVVHVDFCGYDDPEVMNDLLLARINAFPGKDISPSYLWRLSCPLSQPGAQIKPQLISPNVQAYGAHCEFLSVAPSVRGKKHRYVYCLAARRPTNLGNGLAKHDLETGEVKVWYEEGGMAGEPTFLPRPGGSGEEDDGVVLSLHMGADGCTSLLVLDAKSWTEVARARLPYGAPYRFHGSWIPA